MAEDTATPRTLGGGLVRASGIILAMIGMAALALYSVQSRSPSGSAGGGASRPVTHTVSGPAGVPQLKRVLLSTGGVGYFEYEAAVIGTQELQLPVRMDQVDDVLKSIVVFDDKGNTGFVQLPARAPLTDIFRGLPFGPAALESNAALMEALKGAEVSVRGEVPMTGRIASVTKESTKLPDNEGTTTQYRVGVMTSSGLKQFVLEKATSVTFTDPILARQVEQALAAIAEHREGQSRTLKIRAVGEGARTLTIAYVVEAPLWKPSYRITTRKGDKAHLQGWAILENVTGNDWTDVDLTVASGNPVTFRQALYATYYVTRPEVPVEVLGRILPKVDDGGVSAGERDEAAMPPPPPPPPPAPAMAPMEKSMAGGRARPSGDAAATPITAEAKESATQVTFRMKFTVTVQNGQSLAVPIVDSDVPGELVAFYQPETHPRHPLMAVRVVNATPQSLPAGVLTSYNVDNEGTTDYQGDAQMATLPVGDSRLLSFALDQKVLVDKEDKAEKRISKATLSNGIFKASIVDDRTTVYTIKGAAKEDRKVVVEHPRAPGWVLVAPDPKTAEMTDTAFRVAFNVKAGTTIKETVTTQWPREEETALVDIDLDTVLAYASNENLTPAQRAAFTRIGEMKRKVQDIDAQIEAEGEARDRVFEDQGRIRENIKAVPAGSDLQSRYLREMGKLEDEAETHKRNIDRLTRERTSEQQRLADYVAGLQL